MEQPRQLRVADLDVAYLEAGPQDGPLALCLHGFPDHAPTWERLLERLATAGFHAVAPWLRGYSPSGLAPDGNYQVASLALDACALADEIASDRDAVLIGHDWGAIAAYTAVGHRPNRFSKLVTLAVPHPAALTALFLSPEQLKRSFYMFVFQTPLAEMVVTNNDFAFIDYLWRTWSPGYEPEASFMRALKDTLAAPGCAEAAIGYYRAMLGTTAQDPRLSEVTNAGSGLISIPTLYLHGADDGCMGADLVDKDLLANFFPAGLQVEMVPKSGHFLHLEQPDVVGDFIIDFLAS